MFISTFDIFKIGIGPSSSHTMGPMVAAARFLDELKDRDDLKVARLAARLYGSLSFTGKGHATDRAVILGLLGLTPDSLDPDRTDEQIARVAADKRLEIPGHGRVAFDPDRDLIFDMGPPLPGHANGMKLSALDESGDPLLERTYYSIGGGFIADEGELEALQDENHVEPAVEQAPYSFTTAKDMLAMGKDSGLSIVEMKRANEAAIMAPDECQRRLDRVWEVMESCMERGLRADGELPGGLKVKRRAKALREKLEEEWTSNTKPPHQVNDWIALYAMAVNEENAAGGQRGHRPHQRGGGGHARRSCAITWIMSPGANQTRGLSGYVPARGGGDWRFGQAQRVDLGGGMSGARPRSARRLRDGGRRRFAPCPWAARPTSRSRTRPRSRWSTISA